MTKDGQHLESQHELTGGALIWLGAGATQRRATTTLRAAVIEVPDGHAVPSRDVTPGLRGDEVRVVAYQDDWPERFTAEELELRRIIAEEKDLDVEIAHVGSTSVPGMVAKPIIDIALGVREPAAAGTLLAALLAAGRVYIKAGNQPGMLLAGKGDPRTVLYHVVTHGTPAWDRLVLVRQQLRRHRGLAEEYGQTKLDAAARHPGSRLAYAAAKSEIVRAILNRGHLERRRTAAAHAVERQRTALEEQLTLLETGYRGASAEPAARPAPVVDYPTW